MTDQINPDPDWITLCEAVTLLAIGEAVTATDYRNRFVWPSCRALTNYRAWHKLAGACETLSWQANDSRPIRKAAAKLAPLATVAGWRAIAEEETERWERIETAGQSVILAWRREQVSPHGRHEDGGGHRLLPAADIATPYECNPIENTIIPHVKGEGPDKRREFLYWQDIRVLRSEIEALRQTPKVEATPTELPTKRNGTPGPARRNYPKVCKYIDYEIARDKGVDGPREPDRERGRLFLETAKWEDVFERVGRYLGKSFKDNWSATDWPRGRTRRVAILKAELKSHGIDR